MGDLRHRVQVCVPVHTLREDLLDHFTRQRLNPEIGIDARGHRALFTARLRPCGGCAAPAWPHRHVACAVRDLSAGSTDPAIRRRHSPALREVLKTGAPLPAAHRRGPRRLRLATLPITSGNRLENSVEFWAGWRKA